MEKVKPWLGEPQKTSHADLLILDDQNQTVGTKIHCLRQLLDRLRVHQTGTLDQEETSRQL